MSDQALILTRDHLARAYRERLEYELRDELNAQGEGRFPAWRTVATDFTSAAGDPACSVGLVLDPEVGVLLYVVPFHAGMKLSVHVNRALRVRSQLSIERNYSLELPEDCDPNGAWRVAICWIVAASDRSEWLDQVIQIRKGTMFSEEVSLDAVFHEPENLSTALEAHGFPCLLLTTRQILRKREHEDITQWLRADETVRAALKDFDQKFEKEAQKLLAREIVEEAERGMRVISLAAPAAPLAAPIELQSLRILNFRNLGEVNLDFGSDSVASTVIHGPNGTGKSSVCEALSIALFGSSYRYCRFADHEREKDVTETNRATAYISQYLSRLSSKNIFPQLGLNGKPPESVHLVRREQLFESELEMSGTVLTQDTSLEFARMQADELGARVLRNYSELADRLEAFVGERYESANAKRQDYLRRLNLSASITVLDTAYARVARREVDRLVPPSLDTFAHWLARIEELRWKDAPHGLAAAWTEWGGAERLAAHANALAGSRSETATSLLLEGWLSGFNKLVERSHEVARRILRAREEHANELADAERKLRVLIGWRLSRTQNLLPAAPDDVAQVQRMLEDLQKQQQRIVEAGMDARGRLDHLNQMEGFVVQSWSKLHANECPTCGSDHSQHGGIVSVIRSLKADTNASRDRLREELQVVKTKIEEAQKRLSAHGLSRPPLSDEEMAGLVSALQWLLPKDLTLDACLDDEVRRGELLGLLECIRAVPPVPEARDVGSEVTRVTSSLLALYREAEAVFEAPDNWKPIQGQLTQILARVMREHLPGTIAGLWVEIAMNLTSAAWLLPDRPQIDVTTRRGERKSALRMKERLVRYVLNQSEIHVLGLAWFFTRYLTHGRFQRACLILDDPAQEMDQTTFREFCRLLETLCRLHRVYVLPLKLIVLLNQENRALDVARATSGVAHLLGWVPEQKNTITALNMVTPGHFAPLPTRLFATGTSG